MLVKWTTGSWWAPQTGPLWIHNREYLVEGRRCDIAVAKRDYGSHKDVTFKLWFSALPDRLDVVIGGRIGFYVVIAAHLASECGINVKELLGYLDMDSGRGIPHSMWCGIPPGIKHWWDSRSTSQKDSSTWIHPLGFFRRRIPRL